MRAARTTRRPAPRLGERGQMLIMAALFLPVMLGFAGLSIDVGMLMVHRTDYQRAADAAALAGAQLLVKNATDTEAEAAARDYAKRHGYEDGLENTVVEVYVPPVSGPHAGEDLYVEVKITRTSNTLFVRVLGLDSATINARAVGAATPVQKDYALIVLEKEECDAYYQSGSATLTINNGGAIVNSMGDIGCTNNAGAYQSGSSIVTATGLDHYRKGDWVLQGTANAEPPPTRVGYQIKDPLASLARPYPCEGILGSGTSAPPAGCVAKSATSNGSSSAWDPNRTEINSATVLSPGTYYGGLKISGNAGGTVTFLPGLYVFAGGGFEYSGNMALTDLGLGVTFFNTDNPYNKANPASKGNCGPMDIQGSGTLSFTGMSAYKNVIFWQDDDCYEIMKYAGSSYTTAGVMYLPQAQLHVTGGGNLGATQIIVDKFKYTGTAPLTINYTNYIATSIPKAWIAE